MGTRGVRVARALGAPLPTPGVVDWAKEKGEEKAKVNYLNKALDASEAHEDADTYNPDYISESGKASVQSTLDGKAADLSKQARVLKERADAYKTAGRRRRTRRRRRGSRRA